VNFHVYVGNNPVNLLDPLGLENCTVCHKPPPPPCIACHVPPPPPKPKFKWRDIPLKDWEWLICRLIWDSYPRDNPDIRTCAPDPCGPGPGEAPSDPNAI
jgi:hypothetical protein